MKYQYNIGDEFDLKIEPAFRDTRHVLLCEECKNDLICDIKEKHPHLQYYALDILSITHDHQYGNSTIVTLKILKQIVEEDSKQTLLDSILDGMECFK